jgi:predicted RND superfamily exporter protein
VKIIVERLANLVVDHPFLATLLIAVITGLATLGHVDPDWLERMTAESKAVEAQSDEQGQSARELPDVKPIQVGRGDVVLVAEADDFFTPAAANAMRAAVEALEALPQVRSVFWMDRAPVMNIFGLREPILPRATASASRFASAKERALAHPLVGGQLLSLDGQTAMLLVDLDWLFITNDAECTSDLREAAREAVKAFPEAGIRFRITGNVPLRLRDANMTRGNERKYQLIGYGMALVCAWVLFRGWEAVLIVALAPTFGVFWTMGILPLVGLGGNPFNAVVVPVLLVMVGFTDGVHMMVQIRRHRAAGLPPKEATRTAIHEVGLACWLTSLTTGIGFGSLMLAHHELVREFGTSCVIGVLATFIAVVMIVPLASASWLGRNVHRGHGHNLVDKHLWRLSLVIDMVLARPRTFGLAGIVLTLILGMVTLTLRPDQRRTSGLPSSTEEAQALAHIDKVFGGMETAQILVKWSPEVPDGAGEIGDVVAEVESAMREEPLLGSPLSLSRLLAALPGEGAIADRMSLIELLPPPLKRGYYVPENREAIVTFRVQDIGIAAYSEVFERLQARLDEIVAAHPGFRWEFEGSAARRWRDLYQIVMDLATSLGTASLIIFVVLAVAYRSVRIGLISVTPNLFPLVATGTALVCLGQNLELVSVCSFTVCLGIAVDDTIHFLTRFREEQALGGSRDAAIRRAFVGVGTALVMTTVVLILGFATAMLSDSRAHQIFAAMGIMTIGTALFADLLFLPALLSLYADNPPALSEQEPAADDLEKGVV